MSHCWASNDGQFFCLFPKGHGGPHAWQSYECHCGKTKDYHEPECRSCRRIREIGWRKAIEEQREIEQAARWF